MSTVGPFDAHRVADAGQHVGDGVGHHTVLWFLLPTRLSDAGNQAFVGQLAEANPANAELPIHGPRPAANLAAPPQRVENLGFRLAFAIFDLLAMIS